MPVSSSTMEFEEGWWLVLARCPIHKNLVDVSLLDGQEKKWLNDYHAETREKVSPLLQDYTRALERLEGECSPLWGTLWLELVEQWGRPTFPRSLLGANLQYNLFNLFSSLLVIVLQSGVATCLSEEDETDPKMLDTPLMCYFLPTGFLFPSYSFNAVAQSSCLSRTWFLSPLCLFSIAAVPLVFRPSFLFRPAHVYFQVLLFSHSLELEHWFLFQIRYPAI